MRPLFVCIVGVSPRCERGLAAVMLAPCKQGVLTPIGAAAHGRERTALCASALKSNVHRRMRMDCPALRIRRLGVRISPGCATVPPWSAGPSDERSDASQALSELVSKSGWRPNRGPPAFDLVRLTLSGGRPPSPAVLANVRAPAEAQRWRDFMNPRVYPRGSARAGADRETWGQLRPAHPAACQ